jgi:hypothetical protein
VSIAHVAFRGRPRWLARAIGSVRKRLVWGGGARGDHNSRQLDDAFLSRGASLVKLDKVGDGVPDRLVGLAGRDFLVEYKNPGGKCRNNRNKAELRDTQETFHRMWRGRQVFIATSPEDVARIVAVVAG